MAMKPNILAGIVIFTFGAGQAIPAAAVCPTTSLLSQVQIRDTLSNKYGCASRGSERWNELHMGAGFGPHNVQDYKRGPTDTVDPTKIVGTYTIGGNVVGTITYDYGSGGAYTYVVQGSTDVNAPPFTFCNVATFELFRVTVQAAHC
jgi:hypothetical protein